MYTLQVCYPRYRWLYTMSNKTVVACGINPFIDLQPSTNANIGKYPSMQEAHEVYPDFRTILTTDNPSSLPETHPELFI